MNTPTDRLLTVPEAAEQLGTSERFPRRLIAERRIRYVKIGRHVRIPQSALDAYIAARTVEPVQPSRSRSRSCFRLAA
ncbi:helix-turn-helix domain-containing protein [Streptomyces sp. NPDC048644]|uniref:helix-turn-helix domain-containing protein n=1 Tax=Streptomyces sp. NPDC048644 TaxID=3365582 RepID=UPI003720354B